MDVGDLFIAARPRIKRGWQKWVAATGCPLSTAKLYVKLAQHREKIEVEIERVGHPISLQDARRLTAKPRSPGNTGNSHRVAKPNEKLSAILHRLMDRIDVVGGEAEALACARTMVAALKVRGFDASKNIAISITPRKAASAKQRRIWAEEQRRREEERARRAA
jgi:hypothetical protein